MRLHQASLAVTTQSGQIRWKFLKYQETILAQNLQEEGVDTKPAGQSRSNQDTPLGCTYDGYDCNNPGVLMAVAVKSRLRNRFWHVAPGVIAILIKMGKA